DFGDALDVQGNMTKDGIHDVTVDDLRTYAGGPDLRTVNVPATSTLTFTSFTTEAKRAVLSPDTTTRLRSDIVDLVKRYYQPFNVTVIAVDPSHSATTLDEINALRVGGATYELIEGVTTNSGEIDSGLYGKAGGTDNKVQRNVTSDTAVVFANSIFSYLG